LQPGLFYDSMTTHVIFADPQILSTSKWLWTAHRTETQAYKTEQEARKLCDIFEGSDFPFGIL